MSNHFVNLAQQNFQQLTPEQQQKMRGLLGDPFSTIAGVLFSDEVKKFIDLIKDPSVQLVPMPKKAVQFIGEEKLQKFIQKALEDADLMEQEQMAAQPQQQGGFAAPAQQQAQVQQQAPVSPPAPTGLAQRPQLPLPESSNATVIDNQPIV